MGRARRSSLHAMVPLGGSDAVRRDSCDPRPRGSALHAGRFVLFGLPLLKSEKRCGECQHKGRQKDVGCQTKRAHMHQCATSARAHKSAHKYALMQAKTPCMHTVGRARPADVTTWTADAALASAHVVCSHRGVVCVRLRPRAVVLRRAHAEMADSESCGGRLRCRFVVLQLCLWDTACKRLDRRNACAADTPRAAPNHRPAQQRFHADGTSRSPC